MWQVLDAASPAIGPPSCSRSLIDIMRVRSRPKTRPPSSEADFPPPKSKTMRICINYHMSLHPPGGVRVGGGRDVYQEEGARRLSGGGGCSSVVRTFQFGVVPLDWPAPREGLWRPREALPVRGVLPAQRPGGPWRGLRSPRRAACSVPRRQRWGSGARRRPALACAPARGSPARHEVGLGPGILACAPARTRGRTDRSW